MIINPCIWIFLFTICFISCNNDNKQAGTLNTELPVEDSSRHYKIDSLIINSDSIINKLQGEWKEIEYPFRHVHFKDTMVKFTEEGVVEAPTFKAFNISNICPFKVNNIKNTTTNDIFLVMNACETCDILKVSNDTLILSGYSTNTQADYNIIYTRVN